MKDEIAALRHEVTQLQRHKEASGIDDVRVLKDQVAELTQVRRSLSQGRGDRYAGPAEAMFARPGNTPASMKGDSILGRERLVIVDVSRRCKGALGTMPLCAICKISLRAQRTWM